ncbi:MAG: folylpolyglutamate synthase/dihydrofolate synthase family protein [Pirellulales bacterium]
MNDLDPRRSAALDWLFGRINYERQPLPPYPARTLKLDRMRQLLTRLGNPDAGMKLVHVAGTKGKGSTSAMIAAVLTAAGYRTGLYTSPHLERMEERIAIDGVPCSAAELVALVDRLRPHVKAHDEQAAALGDIGPTYFEIATAMALSHFADRQADAVVLEVGLGGRLDSTNVCLPMVSVITSISRDHTRQLGETLAEIAREKAGIIKPGVPVVSGVTDSEPRDVIAEVAHQHGCRLIEVGQQFHFRDTAPNHWTLPLTKRPTGSMLEFDGTIAGEVQHFTDIRLGLLGHHQAANAAVALATLAELKHQGWNITEEATRAGLADIRIPARVEVFPGAPTIIVDTAHNEASAAALVEFIEQHAPHPRVLVASISRDKEVRAIVHLLTPHFDRFVVTQYVENPRAVVAERLAETVRAELDLIGQRSASITICATPADAWQHVLGTTEPHELVCITGSFFLAAEMRRLVVAR